MKVVIDKIVENLVKVNIETVDPDYAAYGSRLAEVEFKTDTLGLVVEEIQQEIDDLEVDASPSALKIGSPAPEGSLRIPFSSDGINWGQGGVLASSNLDSLVPLRVQGRLKVARGENPDDAINKQQLDEAVQSGGVQPDNTGPNPITNSPRSLILKSRNSGIELVSNSNNQSNLILGSDGGKLTGQLSFNSIGSSIGAQIKEGHYQTIIASRNSSLEGLPGHSGIVLGGSSERAIIASSESSINGLRRNTVVLASHRVTMENYTVSGQVKWNIAAIAARECHVKASNSYTIVTGQGNTTNASAQLVLGTYNLDLPSVSIYDPNRKALVVGNGEAGSYSPDGTPQDITRSNAFEVLHKGNAWVQNEFEVGKAGGGVVLKSPNGTRFLLSVDDEGALKTSKL